MLGQFSGDYLPVIIVSNDGGKTFSDPQSIWTDKLQDDYINVRVPAIIETVSWGIPVMAYDDDNQDLDITTQPLRIQTRSGVVFDNVGVAVSGALVKLFRYSPFAYGVHAFPQELFYCGSDITDGSGNYKFTIPPTDFVFTGRPPTWKYFVVGMDGADKRDVPYWNEDFSETVEESIWAIVGTAIAFDHINDEMDFNVASGTHHIVSEEMIPNEISKNAGWSMVVKIRIDTVTQGASSTDCKLQIGLASLAVTPTDTTDRVSFMLFIDSSTLKWHLQQHGSTAINSATSSTHETAESTIALTTGTFYVKLTHSNFKPLDGDKDDAEL